MLKGLLYGAQIQPKESFFNRLVSMDNEDQALLQSFAAELVKTLKIEEAAKFASVVLLKRYEKIKKLENVYQSEQNTLSFAYHFVKAVLDKIGYPIKVEKIFEMIDIMGTEAKVYEVKATLDNTIMGKKLKDKLNVDIPKLVLLILFPLYQAFLKQTPNAGDAKAIFRKTFFEHFFRVIALASSNEERFSTQQKIVLIDTLSPDQVFVILTNMLDKCKLEKAMEVSEKSISHAQSVFEKMQLKARIKHEIGPLKSRISALTDILLKLENPRYREVVATLNSCLKTLVQELYKEGVSNQELVSAKLEKCHLELSTIVASIINEPIDDLTPLHRLVMRSFSEAPAVELEKQQLQRELACLLREGGSLECMTSNYDKGFVRTVLMMRKDPLSVVQLAQFYGNSAILSQAMEVVQTEKEKPLELPDVADRSIGWQRGIKRDLSKRTPPPTPEVSPRVTVEGEGNKRKKV